MLAVIPLFSVAVAVTGTGDCPAPQTVEAALAALAQPGRQAMHGVAVHVAGDRLTVTVHGEDGSVLSSKTFVEPYTCAERAQVAAVYATTWDVATTLDSPLADVQAPPPAARATQVKTAVVRPAATPAASVAPSRTVLRLGAGVAGVAGAALQSDSAGYGVFLESTWRPRSAWGLKAEVVGLPERSFALDVGQAALSRWGGAFAYVRRWPVTWGAWAADAGALLTKTNVRGEGFPSATSESAWVPGAGLGAGFDAPLGFAQLHAALQAGLVVWARAERVEAQSPTVASLALPQAEFLLRLCVAWESRP
ncbi:MAG: hypothetical protein SF187_19960 [Deltaproteobacteria bacterium]|nr:hypothetical protein [Deltaproteobacteria bacterium]